MLLPPQKFARLPSCYRFEQPLQFHNFHYSFFNLGARWGGWLAPRPGRFTPGKGTRYPLYRRLGTPQCRSGRVQKISSPRAFGPRTVQPVASRYTDWAIPTHNFHAAFHEDPWVGENVTRRLTTPTPQLPCTPTQHRDLRTLTFSFCWKENRLNIAAKPPVMREGLLQNCRFFKVVNLRL